MACGLIGTFVRVRPLAFLAGAVAHSALAGLGAAQYIGISPDLGAIPAAVISALLIGWLDERCRTQGTGHEDALFGAIWAVGMAIGILFISRAPGYNVQLLSYLFGSILTAGPERLWIMGIGIASVGAILVILWRPMEAVALDREFALLRGLPVMWLDRLLLILIALTVVLLIKVAVLILVLALLTLAAAVAAHWTGSMARMVLVAKFAALISVGIGMAVAIWLDWPAGPTMILAAASLFALSMMTRTIIVPRETS